MARIPDADRSTLDKRINAVLDAQTKKWGAPLANHLLYARRPAIFRAVRQMWGAIDESGLIDPALKAIINRRVAYLNHCEF
jgi:alkylhydroperoxidase family enzyme